MITLWAILLRKDGFSKRVDVTAIGHKPYYYQMEYKREEGFPQLKENDPMSTVLMKREIFKFKEWVDAWTGVYEEMV